MNKKKVIGVIVIIGLLLIGCAVTFFMKRTTYTLNLPKADDLKSISLSWSYVKKKYKLNVTNFLYF